MQMPVSLRLRACAGMALALCGCHHRAVPQRSAAISPGMVVSQARLVLPAVKGNPGVAYFTLGNEGTAPVTLVRVEIDGARQTEMHQTEIHQTGVGTMDALAQVRIEPGQRVIFAPAGKHVMVFDLAPSLTPEGTSAISFHFQDGRLTSAPLRIESARGAAGSMAGMSMAGMSMPGKR